MWSFPTAFLSYAHATALAFPLAYCLALPSEILRTMSATKKINGLCRCSSSTHFVQEKKHFAERRGLLGLQLLARCTYQLHAAPTNSTI